MDEVGLPSRWNLPISRGEVLSSWNYQCKVIKFDGYPCQISERYIKTRDGDGRETDYQEITIDVTHGDEVFAALLRLGFRHDPDSGVYLRALKEDPLEVAARQDERVAMRETTVTDAVQVGRGY